jgi:hypothetical protein
MLLKLILDEQIFELNVPDALLEQADDFFRKMDADMDRGWMIGREWVEHPDPLQRCKIAADKLMTALETENDNLGRLMAGYILSRVPEIESVEPDVQGEPLNTIFHYRTDEAPPSPAPAAPAPQTTPARPADKIAALTLAGQQVSKVFRAGRHWKFSVLNTATEQWEESPAIGSQDEAERMREAAVRQRYEELCQG